MEREVITIDAQNRRLGNLATEIAYYLEGKNNPAFEYHKDDGARVIVYNIDMMSVHPRKVRQRAYYRHSGYRKGLQKKTWEDLMQEDPRQLLHSAVERMLPKNKLQNERMKRLEMHRESHTAHDN
ncbi:MAG: 50S ribosomal protein L13 [Parcubacteria group bacterium SW_4_49_11]|nr:MAG: 50S ribosomal protein L13 [Parcubacteria group bacterium SW_4_49_11]